MIETMEEELAGTRETPEGLLDRAQYLRAQASSADNDGSRYTALAIAERYEHLAAARLSSS